MPPDTYAAAERVRQAVGAKSVTELVQTLVDVAEVEQAIGATGELQLPVLDRVRRSLGYIREPARAG